MEIQNIYKVRGIVNRRITRGRNKGNLERVFEFSEVVINNLESARAIYKNVLGQVRYECQMAGCFGVAELFIPHIFDDGTLAYWPDSENYINRWRGEDEH